VGFGALGLLVCLRSADAWGAPGDARGFSLEWRGACDGAVATRTRLTELLGGDPAACSEPPLSVAVAVIETDTALDVVIETRQGARLFRREFVSESCREAVEGTALILGFAIDPELEVEALARAAEPRTESLPAPAGGVVEPVPQPEPVRRPNQVRSRPIRFDVGEDRDGADRTLRWSAAGAALLADGLVPSLAFGAELGVGLEWGAAAFDARGFWLAPRRVTFGDSPNEGADIGAYGGAAQGGVRWLSADPLQAWAHASLWYAQLFASAIGTPGRKEGASGWMAATGGVSGSLRLSSSLSLLVRAEIGWSLARPRFLIENRELFQAPGFLIFGSIGPRVRF
jgi:hypothetical protein